jgi:uncharacterized 2Fe-2S/4Fe-4S cluster protein (DUF4445 family)
LENQIRLWDASGNTRSLPPLSPLSLIETASQLTLAQVLFLENLWPKRAFCAGLGRCGLCAVRFIAPVPEFSPEDQAVFSEAQLAHGWRLACRRQALPGLELELPFDFPATSAPTFPSAFVREPQGVLSLAVDLGTTSVQWRLDDEAGTLDSGQDLNPQLAAGSEVMSRLGFALQEPGHAWMLREVVLRWLQPLARSCGLGPLGLICVAGNSVMTALLLGWPLEGLAKAPYALPHSAGFWTKLASDWPDTYIPPLIAPFIGADVSAGLAYLHFAHRVQYPFLLADLGTNGEFLLALKPGCYLGASLPLGPALEGIGLSYGSAALPGVWVDFRLAAGGLAPEALPGATSAALEATPRISGTGYLSLLARLRGIRLLDATGRFVSGDNPLARRLWATLEETAAGKRLALGQGVFLTGRDVEELLKVKAAFNLAFSRLLAEARLVPDDLKTIYLAGALGEHVRLEALEELGFVPPGLKTRIHALGNTSLAGAALLVRSGQARDWIEAMAPRIHVLPIGQEPDFFTQYVQRLIFSYVS